MGRDSLCRNMAALEVRHSVDSWLSRSSGSPWRCFAVVDIDVVAGWVTVFATTASPWPEKVELFNRQLNDMHMCSLTRV